MEQAAPPKPWRAWSPDDLAAERARREALGQSAAAAAPAMAREDRITVAGLSALLCTPSGAISARPHVFVHGGGWVFGSSVQSLGLIRRLAGQARRPVLSIDYPLAPEHPYPQAIYALKAALEELDTSSGIAGIIAASAGAQIAAQALSKANCRRVAGAVLFCGAFRADTTAWSHGAFGNLEGRLTSAAMDAFLAAYAIPPDTLPPAPDQLPPMFLSVGDADPLLADTLDLFARTAARRTGDRLQVIPGVTHGFMNDWHLEPCIDSAIAAAIVWLEDRVAKAQADAG